MGWQNEIGNYSSGALGSGYKAAVSAGGSAYNKGSNAVTGAVVGGNFGPLNPITDNIPVLGPIWRNSREEKSREEERKAKMFGLQQLRTMRNDWGRQQGESWKWRGDRARGRFDGVGNIVKDNPYQNAPKYRQNFYKGYNPQPSRQSTLYNQMPGRQPTQLQDLNKSIAGGTGKYTRGYANNLAANGMPGPSKSSQFYTRAQTEDPNKDLNSYVDELGKWSTGVPSGLRDRANESRQQYGRADELDNDLSDLKKFNPHGTETASWNRTFNRDVASAQQNAFARRLQGPQSETGSMLNDLVAGNTNRGSLLKDISSRGTEGGKFLADLEGGNTAGARLQKDINGVDFAKGAGEFNRTYDPSSLEGLRDTYGKIAAEGPTYEEDFYTSQLTGNNPAYNMLKQDATRDAQRAAAARGGFVSGKSIDMENRTSARLAADEFARRGELAGMAGNARRGRLGQQLDAASALDAQLGNNQGLRLEGLKASDAGTDRKYGLLSGLAQQQDSLRGSSSSALDALRGSVAGGADEQRGTIAQNREQMIGDTASDIDSSNLSAAELALRGVGQQDDQAFNYRQLRSGQSGKVSQRDDNRIQTLNDLAAQEESAALARRGLGLSGKNMGAAGNRSWLESLGGFAQAGDTQDRADKQHYLDAMQAASDEDTRDWDMKYKYGQGASSEGRGNLNDLADLAGRADDYDLNQDKFRWDMAGGAAEEYQDLINQDYNRQMGYGQQMSGVDRYYDAGELDNANDTAMDELSLVGQGYDVDTSRFGDKRAGDRDAAGQVRQDIKDGIDLYMQSQNPASKLGSTLGQSAPAPSRGAAPPAPSSIPKAKPNPFSSPSQQSSVQVSHNPLNSLTSTLDTAPAPKSSRRYSLNDLAPISDRKMSAPVSSKRVVSKSSKRRSGGVA